MEYLMELNIWWYLIFALSTITIWENLTCIFVFLAIDGLTSDIVKNKIKIQQYVQLSGGTLSGNLNYGNGLSVNGNIYKYSSTAPPNANCIGYTSQVNISQSTNLALNASALLSAHDGDWCQWVYHIYVTAFGSDFQGKSIHAFIHQSNIRNNTIRQYYQHTTVIGHANYLYAGRSYMPGTTL